MSCSQHVSSSPTLARHAKLVEFDVKYLKVKESK